jgi:uncharacterized protein
MAELDQEFVEYVVRALVTNPDAVKVRRSVDDMGVLLELTVDPADMGKVIGKAGATAKSIRTLLRVLGAKNDARVNLKIVEPDGAEDANREAAPVDSGEVAAEESAEEPSLREQTKKEIEELADLEI